MTFVNRLSYLLRTAAAGIALGAAGMIAAPAAAQLQAGAALADLGRPDYVHRDMQLFSQGLGLDDGQRMILDALFMDYLAGIEEGWLGTQRRIQDLVKDVQALEQQRDQSKIFEAVMAPFDEWRTAKQRLTDQFEGDVQAILNPEQGERWPQFMQQMAREKLLHLGLLSGESLNLFHHVRDLRMDDRAYMDLEPVLSMYSQELHQAIMSRKQIMDRGATEFIRGLRESGNPPAPRYIGEEVAVRVRIRDINLRYLEEIAGQLPTQHADRFRERAWESAFPRIYRQLPAMRLIDRALELQDLDADVRESIQDIRETFLSELADLNDSLRGVTLEFEPRHYRNRADMEASRHTGQNVERIEDVTRPAYMKRDERAQYYQQLVLSLLTPEQVAKLPGVGQQITGRESAPRTPLDADPRGGHPVSPSRPGGARGSGR